MGNKPLTHEAIEKQRSLIDRLVCRLCVRPKWRHVLAPCIQPMPWGCNRTKIGRLVCRRCVPEIHGLGGAPQLAMPGNGV